MEKNLVLLLLVLLLVSCEKDEGLNSRKILCSQEWEQLSGIVNDVNYGESRQFYKLKFNEDYTCEIIFDYEVYHGDIPDLDSLHGEYSLEGNVIVFTEPIDTLYFGETMTETFVYLNSWRIVRLDATRLEVEPVDDYQPPSEHATLVMGISNYFFEPYEN
jgi:hypothetical protein